MKCELVTVVDTDNFRLAPKSKVALCFTSGATTTDVGYAQGRIVQIDFSLLFCYEQ
jgi:hypothetical protein